MTKKKKKKVGSVGFCAVSERNKSMPSELDCIHTRTQPHGDFHK